MKLIGSHTSPFVRKARIVLAEKRIEYEFIVDNPYAPAATVSEFNPLGKVPVLVTDDGANIYDSSVIVEYLDTVSPVGRLQADTGDGTPAHPGQALGSAGGRPDGGR